jgi:choline monooxygenase
VTDTPLAPTLPAERYVAPSWWARERASLFAQTWVCVGHVAEVPEPGDAVPFTVAGWRLLVVRGPDGVVRVLHNVCRHRAGPLLWDDAAATPARGLRHLQCRYHGWRYALDGERVAAPGFGCALPPGLDLVAAPTATWRGLVFAWPGSGSPAPFESWIAPLDASAASLQLDGLELHSREQHRLDCNWKVYVENYLEGYHIPWLHPALAADVSMPGYRVRVGDRHIVHEVPTSGEGPTAGFWAWVWPTLALNVYGDGVSIERIVPEGPHHTRIDYLYMFRPGSDVDREEALAVSRTLTHEDARICAAVQQGLASGVVSQGVLSPRHEDGLRAFQDAVRAACPVRETSCETS